MSEFRKNKGFPTYKDIHFKHDKLRRIPNFKFNSHKSWSIKTNLNSPTKKTKNHNPRIKFRTTQRDPILIPKWKNFLISPYVAIASDLIRTTYAYTEIRKEEDDHLKAKRQKHRRQGGEELESRASLSLQLQPMRLFPQEKIRCAFVSSCRPLYSYYYSFT